MSQILDIGNTNWAKRRPESWKYTDLSRLLARLPEQLSLDAANEALVTPQLPSLDNAITLSWRGSKLIEDNSPALCRDISATDAYTDLIELNPELAELPAKSWLLDLDQSWQGKTLHLRFQHHAGANRINIKLKLAQGVAIELIEEHCGGSQGLSLFGIDFELAAGSQIHHTRLQHAVGSHIILAQQNASISAGAKLKQIHLDWGAGVSRLRSDLKLQGAQSEIGYFALSGLREKQHCDHQVLVSHESADAKSVMRARGILDDSARQVFNGKIYVARGAQKTDSDQLLRNLLLSDKAEVDAKPELEIYADDVRCAHGSTVGRLDETALFYLRSRGLNAALARQLLMLSFAERILAEISNQQVHDFARHEFAEHLKLGDAE